jgi:hypothetical protein
MQLANRLCAHGVVDFFEDAELLVESDGSRSAFARSSARITR